MPCIWGLSLRFQRAFFYLSRDAVPELTGIGFLIPKSMLTVFLIMAALAIEDAARNLELFQGSLDGQVRILHQMDDLQLLLRGSSDQSSHPSPSRPSKLFLSTLFFKGSSATSCLSYSFSCLISLTFCLALSVACQSLLPSFQELIGPFVIQALDNPLAAAEFRHCDLPFQAL